MGVEILRYHTCIAILCGFLLDLLLGDPETWPHPVRFIGRLIDLLERALYPVSGPEMQKFWRGFFLACVVPVICGVTSWLFLKACFRISPWAGIFFESVMCWQILAVKSLADASEQVYRALREEGLPRAREAVSRIVGRDTENLTEEGVVRAAVETVAENLSDGVTAPLIYLMLAGPVGGWVYKSVNTMDSMIGYKNDRYLLFGRAAAHMDDVLNFLPSRISAVFVIAASALCGFDWKNAAGIWRRDRRKHPSPNSAQTESAVAGALGLRLAGPLPYFGKMVDKPYLGDPLREAEPEDIRRADRILYAASWISVAAVLLVRAGFTALLFSG